LFGEEPLVPAEKEKEKIGKASSSKGKPSNTGKSAVPSSSPMTKEQRAELEAAMLVLFCISDAF
jgi:hypothetical protein